MKEYGGCLHFEPLMGHETGGYYDGYSDNKIDVDSGRSAIQWILENGSYKRIWLPVYNCPLVGERIRRVSDLEICWYNIREDFYPAVSGSGVGDGDILLWVDHCGVVPDDVIDKVVRLSSKTGCEIVIDNIPAYFSKPRMEVLNIYSCRKFLGVPDGGHIIGHKIRCQVLPTYLTASNYTYLLKAIESGSDSAYGGYQDSERRFLESDTAYGMPLLTKKVLGRIDYLDIIHRRKQNFDTLHEILGASNRFMVRSPGDEGGYRGLGELDPYTPSVYPYLTSKKQLREKLIDAKVFVPRLWKHVLTNDKANAFERDLAEYLIPLPIDQRYPTDAIKALGQIVKEMER